MPSSRRSPHAFREELPSGVPGIAERQQAHRLEALTGLRRLRRDRALEEATTARLELDRAMQRRAATHQQIDAVTGHMGRCEMRIGAVVQAGGAGLRQIQRDTDAVRQARFDLDWYERQLDRCDVAVEAAGAVLTQREQAARGEALGYERMTECRKFL